MISSVTRLDYSFLGVFFAAALDEEYVSTYFLATSEEWFFIAGIAQVLFVEPLVFSMCLLRSY